MSSKPDSFTPPYLAVPLSGSGPGVFLIHAGRRTVEFLRTHLS